MSEQLMLMEIAEKLDKWLDDTAREYNILKMDLQELIKRLLIG